MVYSYLTSALLAWGRSGHTNAAKIECAESRAPKLLTYYNRTILTLNLWLLCFNKIFQRKYPEFSSIFQKQIIFSQPSHMHNTRHSTKCNFNALLFNHSKFKKMKYAGWYAPPGRLLCAPRQAIRITKTPYLAHIPLFLIVYILYV